MCRLSCCTFSTTLLLLSAVSESKYGNERQVVMMLSFGCSEDCSGRVVWSKLSMASLCHQWLKNVNGSASPLGLNGVSVETMCSLDFVQAKLQVLYNW